MKNTIYLLIALFFLNSCAVFKNSPQESEFMKVSGGGYLLRGGIRQQEEIYSVNIKLKNIPEAAKYLIADFELPNNKGVYDRKVFEIDENKSSILITSNPIYGIEFGFYCVKAYLSEDKNGDKIIDSLKQSVKMYAGMSKGRDYATQYTIFNDKEEIKKLLVISPNKRRGNKLIAAVIPNEYKMAHAAVAIDESIVEYVPKKENIYNWSKIVTLRENKHINDNVSKPYMHTLALGNGMYKKFFKKDKKFQVTYSAIHNGKFINVETPNFQELVKKSSEVTLYVDYKDYALRSKKHPHEREYLVAKTIKSDVSVWELQCTVRYDKRWPKKKIESLKKEAMAIVINLRHVKSNPIDDIHKIAKSNDIKNIHLETQRLDDRDLNEKFKNMKKSPYKK